MFPSPSQRPLSPVRYSLPPFFPLNPSSTNRSTVSSTRFKYPRATCTPPIHSSPDTPTGDNMPPFSPIYNRVFQIGLPIGTRLMFPSAAHDVTSIVASVGPYRLCSSAHGSRSLNDRTCLTSSPSPLHNTFRMLPHSSSPSSCRNTSSIDGTKCNTVIPFPSISSLKYPLSF